MNWEIILITFGFMILGYFIGSLTNAIYVTKLFNISDIRNLGSKNLGSTNALRIHGKTIGLIVLILDVLKPIIAILIPFFALGPEKVILQPIGIAVVLGHIFPIFNNFKGGKGAACMLGLFIITNWTLFFIGCFIFFAIVLPTKKVSLGSIFAPIILIIIYGLLSLISGYRSEILEPIMHVYKNKKIWINIITICIVIIIVILAHKENIKRLLQGKENKINHL